MSGSLACPRKTTPPGLVMRTSSDAILHASDVSATYIITAKHTAWSKELSGMKDRLAAEAAQNSGLPTPAS